MGGERNGIGTAEAASALGWWLESGVDIAVQEEPRNWLKPENWIASEEPRDDSEIADLPVPDTLDLFRGWLQSSRPPARAASRAVLPKGVADAPAMLLCDAPSGEDAVAGEPLSGEAWQLAGRMLAAIGIEPENAYVANISCFHAPGTRMSEKELAACAEIARKHVALARPKRLLLLGDTPAKALLGKPLAAARGHIHKVEGVRTVATFNPRLLLDNPSQKALAWKDLLLLMEEMN